MYRSYTNLSIWVMQKNWISLHAHHLLEHFSILPQSSSQMKSKKVETEISFHGTGNDFIIKT